MSNSSVSEETEVTFYSKISDMEGLKKANYKVKQIQSEGKINGKLKCRVRSSDTLGKVLYEMTMKEEDGEVFGIKKCKEHSVEINKDFFDVFLKSVGTYFKKTRYVFVSDGVNLIFNENGAKRVIELPKVNYEVDVFQKQDGTMSEWCKIDVELDSVIAKLSNSYPDIKDYDFKFSLNTLPLGLSGTIIAHGADIEQKQLLDKFWDEVRLTK